jgi:hypothetical protein
MRTISLLAVAACLILVGVAVRAAATPPQAEPFKVQNFRGATPAGGLYVMPPVY